jgi:serine/threonine-protein kinase
VDDAVIGTVFAGHRLDEVAGRGGMGVVYRATDLALDRHVAVKLIAPALADDPAFRSRFVSESKVAASLDHPNVVPIHHAGEQDGVLFQVMRYVEGEDLRSMLRREGRLEPERAAPIVAQVAAALDAAHAHGLVHRDVKPANVLLDAKRHVYLTDFGLSVRLGGLDDSRPGRLLGTVHYISPEQIRGEEIGVRSDVYALGAMLFHMLTGGVPFPADTDEARLWAHLSEPPPTPSRAGGRIPVAFDAVIARAMAKNPAHRYASAGELSRAVQAAVGEPAAPPPPAAPADDRRALATRALADPFSLATAGAIVLAGVILGGLALALPLALVVYLAGAARAYLDDDIREAVRATIEPARPPPPASRLAEEIQLLLRQAAQTRARVHDAIEEAGLPYTEVAAEVDRLVATMHDAAARAQRLHEGLRDAPPDEVAARLERVKAENDPARADLVAALGDQLAVQRRMEVQLGHFYAEMDRMLIELDTVRGHLVSASASSGRDNQAQVAGEVRELRDDLGAVAAGIDQGSVTVVKVPR